MLQLLLLCYLQLLDFGTTWANILLVKGSQGEMNPIIQWGFSHFGLVHTFVGAKLFACALGAWGYIRRYPTRIFDIINAYYCCVVAWNILQLLLKCASL